MTETRDQTVRGNVVLDGNTFVNCQFTDARMIYEGGTPPNFTNCAFTNSNFVFQAAAGNTLNFLRAMLPAQTNMRQVVFGLMPELNQN